MVMCIYALEDLVIHDITCTPVTLQLRLVLKSVIISKLDCEQHTLDVRDL